MTSERDTQSRQQDGIEQRVADECTHHRRDDDEDGAGPHGQPQRARPDRGRDQQRRWDDEEGHGGGAEAPADRRAATPALPVLSKPDDAGSESEPSRAPPLSRLRIAAAAAASSTGPASRSKPYAVVESPA